VPVEDLGHVRLPDLGVHDAFRVDQHARSLAAGAHAPGSGHLDAVEEVALLKLPEELLVDGTTAVLTAGAARMPRRALLGGDEDVFREFRH
jgi:hypothetical protein